MQAPIALREETKGAARLSKILPATGIDLHQGAEAIAVALRSLQIESEPVIPGLIPVMQEETAVSHGGHQDIHPSVVVVINHTGAAPSNFGPEVIASFGCRIGEGAVATVFQQQALPAHQVMGVAIGDENVQFAGIVKIQEATAPTHKLRGQ